MRLRWKGSFRERLDALESGGGANLSSVDQDIGVLNGHIIDFQSSTIGEDATAHAGVGWSDDNYAPTVIAPADNGESDFVVQSPDGTGKVVISAGDSDGIVGVFLSSPVGSPGLTVNSRPTSGSAFNTMATNCEIRIDLGSIVLKSPDNSYHRLLVANDGSLSTEAVTY